MRLTKRRATPHPAPPRHARPTRSPPRPPTTAITPAPLTLPPPY